MKATSGDVVASAAPLPSDRTGLVIDLHDAQDRAYLRNPASVLPAVVVCLLASDAEPPDWFDPPARKPDVQCVLVVVRTPARAGASATRARSPRMVGSVVDEAFTAAAARLLGTGPSVTSPVPGVTSLSVHS